MFEQDQKVTVSIPGGMVCSCEVVGKSTEGISNTWIVKCIDGQIPNSVYKFNTFVIPEGYIEAVEVIDDNPY